MLRKKKAQPAAEPVWEMSVRVTADTRHHLIVKARRIARRVYGPGYILTVDEPFGITYLAGNQEVTAKVVVRAVRKAARVLPGPAMRAEIADAVAASERGEIADLILDPEVVTDRSGKHVPFEVYPLMIWSAMLAVAVSLYLAHALAITNIAVAVP